MSIYAVVWVINYNRPLFLWSILCGLMHCCWVYRQLGAVHKVSRSRRGAGLVLEVWRFETRAGLRKFDSL